MFQLVGAVVVVVAFYWAYKRLHHSTTDSVTRSNRKHLGRWLLILTLLFWIFALSFSHSFRP